MSQNNELLQRILKLKKYFDDGLIPRLHLHEVNPGLPKSGRENYLYFTLPVTINFQRSSPAMWSSALKTWNDLDTRYVFFPEKLAITNLDKIRADLLKHRLALQPNKHILIWTTIATTLHSYYHDDPREIILEAENDATILLHNLHERYKKRFPYLSGPKLSNYWPYILQQYTDLHLNNANSISIIPDTHVIQSSIRLEMVPPQATSAQVELAWKKALLGSGISPTTMHPILWNWSRNNFQPEV
ncbi:MAG: hypothetical protein WBB39_00475 [Candidatus Saccharimonadales bacterium]